MSLKWIKTSKELPKANQIVIGKYEIIKRNKKKTTNRVVWRTSPSIYTKWGGIGKEIKQGLFDKPDYWIDINDLEKISDKPKKLVPKKSRFDIMDVD